MMRIAPILLAACLAASAPSLLCAGGMDLGEFGRAVRKTQKTAAQVRQTRDELHLGRDNEIELGRATAATLLGKYGLYSDEALTRYVNLVGLSVSRKAGRKDIRYRFGILNTKMLNAFACPGGYVFITKGLLFRLQDESQLAGVLGHEITHVDMKHAINAVIKAKALGLAGKHLFKDEDFERLTQLVIQQVAEKALPRSDEYQADKGGVLLLKAAGYRPAGLPNAMRRLFGGSQQLSLSQAWASRHPPLAKRLARMDAKVRTLPDSGSVLQRRFLDSVER